MSDGWVKLFRKMKEWEWYTEPDTLRVFLHLLLSANHTKTTWRGQVVEEGEVLTGRRLLARELKIGETSVRTSLERLKSTSSITIKKFPKYSLIKIKEWPKYQEPNHQTNRKPTINQPPNQPPTNHIQEEEEEKNEKKVIVMTATFVAPTVEQVKEYCLERGNEVDPNRFVDFYASKGWVVGKTKMKDWKAAVRGWEGRAKSDSTTNGIVKI